MNTQDFFFFSVFAALGIFRVSLRPFTLALIVSSFIVFMGGLQPDVFMGIPLERNWGAIFFATLAMAVIYTTIYIICFLASVSIRRLGR